MIQILALVIEKDPLKMVGSGEEYVGATGQFISAVMQTAGLYVQGTILRDFGAFLDQLGALLFIFGAIGGLVAMAIYGSYKDGLYLLLGPALFYWMVGSTVSGNATEIKFGSRVVQNSAFDQHNFLKLIGESKEGQPIPKVSWVFATYDNLVSSVVQGLVSWLIDTQNKQDMLNAARERLFSQVLLIQGGDPGFSKLVAYGVMGECANATQMASRMAQLDQSMLKLSAGNLVSGDQQIYAQWKYERQALQTKYDLVRSEKNIALDDDVKRYLNDNGRATSSPVSCNDVWDHTQFAALKSADAWLKKLGKPSHESVTGEDDKFWDGVRVEVEKALKGNNPGTAQQIIAAYMIKNTIGSTTAGTMQTQIAGRKSFGKLFYDIAYRRNTMADAKGSFTKLIFFGGFIPYLQGLILFLLTAAFPFFALFLILPSHRSGFVLWMSLWLWVKSWDVGFAMVHFIRDILWQFMHKGVSHDSLGIDPTDLTTVFQVINYNDPISNQRLYYFIISLLTLSVPLLTAQICMGANTLYSAFRNSFTRIAEDTGSQAQGQARRFEVQTPMENLMNQWERNQSIDSTTTNTFGGNLTSEQSQTRERRIAQGDGAMPRWVQDRFDQNQFNVHFSQQGMEYQAALATTTGRRRTHSPTSSQGPVNAAADLAADQYVGHPLGELFPDKPRNDATSAKVAFSGQSGKQPTETGDTD